MSPPSLQKLMLTLTNRGCAVDSTKNQHHSPDIPGEATTLKTLNNNTMWDSNSYSTTSGLITHDTKLLIRQ